ncbi:MAG: diguanylate cyclase [Spirochaetales bacterium]|nr:diguanylate cyclase [Spirochaetales bacterium]
MSKIDLFKNTEIFSVLNDEELKFVADCSEYQSFEKDVFIFEKESPGRNLYIVESGEVSIKTELDDDKAIAYFIRGEIFGEFDLFEGDMHTAYAIAGNQTKLLVFPKKGLSFDSVYKKHPGIFAKIYRNLINIDAERIRNINKMVSEKSEWIENIKKLMLFDKLTGLYNRSYIEDELYKNYQQLGNVFSVLVVKPDNFKMINDTFGHEAGDIALTAMADKVKILLRENDIAIRYRGNEMVIVLPATHLDEAEKEAQKYFNECNAIDFGKIIGKKSLALDFSVGVSCFPQHAANLEDLLNRAYTKLFEQRDAGGRGILLDSQDIDKNIEFLKTVALFSSLYPSELSQIAKHLHASEIKKGTVICSEGDEGNELFIIKKGRTSVLIKVQNGSTKEVAELLPGDFLGEMAIFQKSPRSATCVAKEESIILKLDEDDFFNLMKTAPETAIKIMKIMLDSMSARVSNTGNFLKEMVKWGNDASQRAITDKLTGVYNRRYLETVLTEKYEAAQKQNTAFSIIMADLDFFREVNEGYSHEIGDLYIVEVAKVFQAMVHKNDIVARYGGDEFTLLLIDTGLEKAAGIAENIRTGVMNLDFLKSHKGPDIHVSVSLGISCFPETGTDLNVLREQADKALYEAKESGRNCVKCFKK